MLRTAIPASADPVSLAEAKAQLRITDTSQDELIKMLVASATLAAQARTQRRFMRQTVEWVQKCWKSEMRLPIAPVAASDVVSIKYIDWTTQAQHTLDPLLYVVQTSGASVSIIPKFATIWPIIFTFSPEPIVVRFNVGYADASSVPANVKQAILMTIRHHYSLGEHNLFLKRDSVMGIGEKSIEVDPGSATLLTDAAAELLASECWE